MRMRKIAMKFNKVAFRILMIAFLSGLQTNIISQEAIRIKRLTLPVEFDGIPKEASWEALDLFSLTMHKPNYGAQPSEKSEVRIGYDNEYLWVGASLYMQDASKIFAVTKKRDEELFDYDAFGIILDTYNDNENGSGIFYNSNRSQDRLYNFK